MFLVFDHLGHLCYIFSRWLEPKWASEAGDSLEPRGVHAQAPAPAACEMRALRVQVLELFKSTLCPAIVELASTFQRPKNVALTALALARLCRSTKDEKDEKAIAIVGSRLLLVDWRPSLFGTRSY